MSALAPSEVPRLRGLRWTPEPRSPLRASASHGGKPLGYSLARSLIRLLLGVFYRRIDVVGADRIPPTGPLIVAANHHNSVVDAMVVLAVFGRPLRTLANAPLFDHPLIGPFLRLVRALPVHRRQEAGIDPARNAALFEATTATLQAGGAVLVFPEGRTQPEPVLMALRTGAARMLLAADTGAKGSACVTLLPVGLVFQEPGAFRSGRALVLIGRPVPTADCLSLAETAPDQAARRLTDRLADALRGQIVEAGDRPVLRLLGLVEELWNEEIGGVPGEAGARVAWRQRAIATYRRLLRRQPARVAVLRGRLEALADELERAGLSAKDVSRPHPPGSVARVVLGEGLALLLGAPLAACGMAAHAVPYGLTATVVRRLGRTDEEEATDKIAAGLVLYPLAWTLEAWGAFRLGGGWSLAAFLVALLPLGFCTLGWLERLDRFARAARALARSLRDRDLPERLREESRALAIDVAALAHLEPEEPPG